MGKSVRITLLSALAAVGVARADTLIMEGIDQARATAGQRPSAGMTMDKVAGRWGAPETKDPAVGKPPITRWEYRDFVVYFEYDHVIHAVARHP
jgi:hypothetical protein